MTCYKCRTTRDLSMKTEYLMICKGCRTNAYHYAKQKKVISSSKASKAESEDYEAWKKKSRESIQKILNGNYTVVYK